MTGTSIMQGTFGFLQDFQKPFNSKPREKITSFQMHILHCHNSVVIKHFLPVWAKESDPFQNIEFFCGEERKEESPGECRAMRIVNLR